MLILFCSARCLFYQQFFVPSHGAPPVDKGKLDIDDDCENLHISCLIHIVSFVLGITCYPG